MMKKIGSIFLAWLIVLQLVAPVGAAHYVRADGTATKASGAPGDITTAANCWNLDTLNACTAAQIDSANGDTVWFGADGGAFTKQFTVPKQGTAGHMILYAGIEGNTPTINDSANAANAAAIVATSKSYIKIRNFLVKGSGGATAVATDGTCGNPGYTDTIENVKILSNYGASNATNNHDGFGGAQTMNVVYIDCEAHGCRENPASTGSHQGLATHTSGAAKWYRGRITDCNYWCTAVGTSYNEFHNTVFDSCHVIGLTAGGTAGIATTKAYACTISTNKGRPIESSVSSLVLVDGCVITITGAASSALLAGTLTIQNSTLAINSATSNWRNGAGTVNVLNNIFTITDVSGSTWSSSATDAGIYNFRRNRFTCASTDNVITISPATPQATITGNLFFDCNSTQAISFTAASTGVHEVSRNTFYRTSKDKYAVKLGAISSGSISVSGNIFMNITDAINGTPTVVSYNDYLNSSNEGGTGSITTGPAFIDSIDFKITNASPCYNTGIATSLLYDYYNDPIPNSAGGYSMGWYEVNDNSAHACVWQGDVDSAFDNADNWHNGIIPGDTDVVIYTSDADRNCVWNQNVTVLRVDSDSTLDKNVLLGSGTHAMGTKFDLRCPSCSLFNQTSSLSIETDLIYPALRVSPGTSTIDLTGATGVQVVKAQKFYDLIKSGISIADFGRQAITVTGDAAFQGGEVRDTSSWTCSGDANFTGIDAYYTTPGAVWNITGTSTVTSAGKYRPKRINIRPLAAQTVAFADAIKCDSLFPDSGTVTFAGAGNDSIMSWLSVANGATFNDAGDTIYYGGDISLGATSTITNDAASKWIFGKDGVVLAVNGKSIPLVQLIGTGRINGGATIAQLLPASDDSVIIQAATRVNITSLPATTWDGTAGHLKYFLTPTINQGCTLTTPAYTASYGYYGGIHGDSIDAAFSRGCKSRGDN